MRKLWTILGLVAVMATTHAVQPPAFLDAFDEIRVYVGPQPRTVEEFRGQLRASLDGKSILLRGIAPGEPAPFTPDPGMVSLPGTLAGGNWDPADPATQMVSIGPEQYEVVLKLAKGRYEFKLARGGTWAENYGAGFTPAGSNIILEVPADQLVRFVADFARKTLKNSVDNPDEVSPGEAVTPRKPAPPTRFVSLRVFLAKPLTPEAISRPLFLRIGDQPVRRIIPREVLSKPEFQYSGPDLGPTYSKQATTFKVWSPVASRTTLQLGNPARAYPMRRGTKGVWYVRVPGDWHAKPYHYDFESLGERRFAADIYGKTAIRNSSRSVVVDLGRTNPAGWPVPRLFKGKQHTDAILYEAHVRDFTIQAASGVNPKWRGKYLGLTQTGTQITDTSLPSGLDYLKSLGITHLHLLPFQDFNPAHSDGYNWGYETTLFNVPEEQYVVNPNDPLARISETKQMIAALQRAGIGVVLDVVYNHSVPSQGAGSAFWQTVPYYYFRTNDRGDVLNESGVGNALHDERPMVRKFIRDSLRFWTKEYRLDGYRFDLIGMFTRATNIDLAKAIRQEHPDAVIYGEPWTGGGPMRFGKGDQRGTGVAVFNDRFRGVFRGELDGPGPGFGMGGTTSIEALVRVISGSVTDYTDSPQETVNYVSAHDNLTFADKIALAMPDTGEAGQERVMRFAHAAVLLSQGMPFIEGGVELGRTKAMNNNSYNAGDAANQYDWARATRFQDRAEYFRGLFAVRRAFPGFRLRTAEEIQRYLTFTDPARLPNGVVGFRIQQPDGQLQVYLNSRQSSARVTLPEGTWSVLVHGELARATPWGEASENLVIPEVSATVLFKPDN